MLCVVWLKINILLQGIQVYTTKKKRFITFVNHFEGFTRRIASRFPETGELIEAEKRSMLDKFPKLALQASSTSKTTSAYEKVQNTLNISVNISTQQCYHQLDIKRDTLDCIQSVNLLSRTIGNANKDILYYSALQGRILLHLNDSSTPEGFRQILQNYINISKPHVNFLIRFYKLVAKYPRIIKCELPQNFSLTNINTVELVCDNQPDVWRNI